MTAKQYAAVSSSAAVIIIFFKEIVVLKFNFLIFIRRTFRSPCSCLLHFVFKIYRITPSLKLKLYRTHFFKERGIQEEYVNR